MKDNLPSGFFGTGTPIEVLDSFERPFELVGGAGGSFSAGMIARALALPASIYFWAAYPTTVTTEESCIPAGYWSAARPEYQS